MKIRGTTAKESGKVVAKNGGWDISTRNRVGRELKESQEFMSAVLENLAYPVLIVGPDASIQYINPALEKLTGYSSEEVIGCKFPCPWWPTDKLEQYTLDFSQAFGKGPNKMEKLFQKKNGDSFWVEINSRSIRDKDQQLKYQVDSWVDITERKKAEEALDESQAFNFSLLENAPNAVVGINPDTSIKYVNRAFEKLNGWTLDEIAGLKVPYPWWPEELRTAFADRFKAAFEQGSGQGEVIAQKKNGERYWLAMNWSSVTRDGRLSYLLINSMDITARKRAEDALKESESKYSTLVEKGNDGIIILQDWKVKFCNRRMEELTGFSPDDYLDKPFIEFVSPQYRGLVLESYKKRMAGQKVPDRYEIELLAKDHGSVPMEINASVIEYENKPADMAILRDMTERKRMDEELRVQRDRANTYLDIAGVIIVAIDCQGKVRLVNKKGCEILGFKQEEIMDKNWFDHFLPERNRALVKNVFNQILAGQAKLTESYENPVLTKQGEERVIAWHNALIRDETGNITGTLSSGEDITQRKRAEESLKESEEHFRLMTKLSPSPMFVNNGRGGIEYVNDRFTALFGYTVEDVPTEKIWFQRAYPDEGYRQAVQTSWRQAEEQAKLTNKPFEAQEYWVICKDGSACVVEVSPAQIGAKTLVVFSDVTQHRRIEEDLKKSNTFNKDLLLNAPNPVLATNLDTSIRYVNPAFENLTGFSRAELVGCKSPYPWWTTERVQEFENFSIENSDKDLRSVERLYKKKNGERIWVNLSMKPVKYDRQVEYYLSNWVDITTRKHADEELQRKRQTENVLNLLIHLSLQDMPLEEVLRQAVETIFSIPWLAFESKGCIFLADDNSKSLLMIAQSGLEEETKRTCSVVAFGGCLCGRAALTQQIYFANLVNETHEVRHDQTSPHGHYCVPIVYAGKTTGVINIYLREGHVRSRSEEEFLGSIADTLAGIIERKRAEEALRQSEEKLRLMFQSAKEGIIVADLNGVILEVNQMMLDMHGLASKEQAVGKSALEFVAPDNRERVQLTMEKTLEVGMLNKFEFTSLRPDGQTFPAEASAGVMKDREGNPVALISTFRDVTETKRLQQQLMLTDRLASVGELASGVAHELNNPLTSIIGFTQLLLERDIPTDLKEDLGLVNSEAQRCANIVKNLLTFARKHAPVKQLGRVNDIIEDVLRLRAYERKVNNLEIERRFAPDLPEIMVDYFQMQQVFLNLIINAEYFMIQAHNRGLLTIVTERLKSTVRISIADDGPGIPKENLSHLFNPFFTTKEVGKGTGLGLSICHGIVAEHGGKVYATSQPGKGATFIVELPVDSN